MSVEEKRNHSEALKRSWEQLGAGEWKLVGASAPG
jgi:hypothetical protein